MKHPIQELIENRKKGIQCGIPSYCTAHPLVLEAALKRAKLLHRPVLIEATANQVNQYGGYTGMRPDDFRKMIWKMADENHVSRHSVILAGDHLGPLLWQHLPEKEAMDKSSELVYQYARAGFTKIHLDTSMKTADDPEGPLSTETIARRGAQLYKASIQGYMERKADDPEAMRPVFVIGSEVPIPGGAQEAEDSLAVTSPDSFQNTVTTYRRIYEEAGVGEGWNDVVAVVVQPGVEFGDDQVFLYDHDAASGLCSALKEYPQLCFEGHSTDYQSPECLKSMVEDGIAILKVGPALTYGLRNSLFALSFMEKELLPENEQAHFIETLEGVMRKNPENWQKHYHGNEYQIALARKYSFSDRARYYIGHPDVVDSMEHLFANLRKHPLPMNMLYQYMPLTYAKVRDGILNADPRELAMDGAVNFMQDYEYATGETA